MIAGRASNGLLGTRGALVLLFDPKFALLRVELLYDMRTVLMGMGFKYLLVVL